jgi:hypothetical protein
MGDLSCTNAVHRSYVAHRQSGTNLRFEHSLRPEEYRGRERHGRFSLLKGLGAFHPCATLLESEQADRLLGSSLVHP